MFSILHDAGECGLTTEQWNEHARDAGIGIKRKADLYDIRVALKSKGLFGSTATDGTSAYETMQRPGQINAAGRA